MVQVSLWRSLQKAAGGSTELEVEANNVKQLLKKLSDRYPGLKAEIDKGVSVSINGEIHRKAGFQQIPDGAEVVIFPLMKGG